MAGLTVYVGDSMSDLAPLLAADIGIVIGQNKLLRRVAKAAGIQLKALVCGKDPWHIGHGICTVKFTCTDLAQYVESCV